MLFDYLNLKLKNIKNEQYKEKILEKNLEKDFSKIFIKYE